MPPCIELQTCLGFPTWLMLKRCSTLAWHFDFGLWSSVSNWDENSLSPRLRCLRFLYVYFVWDGRVGVRMLGFLSLWLLCGAGYVCIGTIGCTNNNYASREKCKKCGQPKEVAAMPAIAMTGASFPTYSHYFSRAPGVPEQKMNIGLLGNGAPSQSLHLNSNWPVPGADKYGVQPLSIWLPGGNYGTVHHHENSTNQNLSVPKGWRNGDWICNCGFHNYSSRSQVCLEFYLKMMLSYIVYKSWTIHCFSDSILKLFAV